MGLPATQTTSSVYSAPFEGTFRFRAYIDFRAFARSYTGPENTNAVVDTFTFTIVKVDQK